MSTHKAAGGKASQHISPEGKRLGAKVSGGQKVVAGAVLVRQRGKTFGKGAGVRLGRDHTAYAIFDGVVKFGQKLGKRVISVVSA
ncbi:MAG TPA: 50S ribosomal protein L27 [Patescibacteria group bacterium]|nr:50S ribosomal protein L27 [Patescibacteria group bacterium]